VNSRTSERDEIISQLEDAGCIAPEEEADELIEAARDDEERLEALVLRRVTGEPLAWITGAVNFAGRSVKIHPGVYVPRWQTEALVRRAIDLIPDDGLAADLCTGSGAIAMALGHARPSARVVASEIDPVAWRCAQDNGVEVYAGHLDEPLPFELRGRFDVVIAVVPYVPSEEFAYLPRDVRDYEPRSALDGGPHGTRVLVQAVWAGARLLHMGGALLLELGGEQDDALESVLGTAGFDTMQRFSDEEGDLRGIEATLGAVRLGDRGMTT
jgi:release factor glutamine methyltransferase